MAEYDDPQKLLEVGTAMMHRLVGAIERGYVEGQDENKVIMAIFDPMCEHPIRMVSAMCTAAMFELARNSKWDLVMENANGTRVVIHCDTEEEQERKALQIMTKEQLA